MWTHYEGLSLDDKYIACTVYVESDFRIFESVIAKMHQDDMVNELGMFLVINPPGREGRNYAADWVSWQKLKEEPFRFSEPPEYLMKLEKEILSHITIHDTQQYGIRSAFSLNKDCVTGIRELVSKFVAVDPLFGGVRSIPVRTGDQEDYEILRAKNSSSSMYKLPNTLYSGTLGNLVAVLIVKSINRMFVNLKEAVEFSTDYYVRQPLNSVVLDTKHIHCCSTEKSPCASFHDLFSIPLNRWGSDTDRARIKVADQMIERAANDVADSLLASTIVETSSKRQPSLKKVPIDAKKVPMKDKSIKKEINDEESTSCDGEEDESSSVTVTTSRSQSIDVYEESDDNDGWLVPSRRYRRTKDKPAVCDSSIKDQVQAECPSNPVSTAYLLSQDLQEMAAMLETIAHQRSPWQKNVAELIKLEVKAVLPEAISSLFGSLESGLAAPCSDVDMVVGNCNQSNRTAIRALFSHLKTRNWIQMIELVERSSIPVIRLSTAQIPISFGNQGSLINVDISFASSSHNGLATCALVQQLVNHFPLLKPMCLVLKQFLVEKGLNDPFVGGLSSYGLVLMITSVLENLNTAFIPENELLGTAFIEFLKEYSNFEFIERGVWINWHSNGTTIDHLRHQQAPMYILDPLDPENNVGRSCFGISQVIQAFQEGLEAIQLSSMKPGGKGDWSLLGSVFSTGHHRHVIHFVTQVWCPRENPMKIPRMEVQDWANKAKQLILSLEFSGPGKQCPICHQTGSHKTDCNLRLLLES